MYGGPPMPGGGGGGGSQYPTSLGPPRGPALGFDNLASQPPMGTPGVSTTNQSYSMAKIACGNDTFLEIFELEASLAEGRSHLFNESST